MGDLSIWEAFSNYSFNFSYLLIYLCIFIVFLFCRFLSSNLIELHFAALSFVAAIVVATLTILPSCKLASCSFIWTTIGTQQLNLNFVDPQSATCERCQLFSPSFSPSPLSACSSSATSCSCCCCNGCCFCCCSCCWSHRVCVLESIESWQEFRAANAKRMRNVVHATLFFVHFGGKLS